MRLHPETPGGEQKARQSRQIAERRNQNGEGFADLARKIDQPLHRRVPLDPVRRPCFAYSIEPRSAFTTHAWPCCSMLSTLP